MNGQKDGTAHMQKESCPSWLQMIEEKQFVNIKKIYDHFGRDICSILPQFHAITGCDQTSYKFNAGKIRAFNKVLKDTSVLQLIQPLGKRINLSDEVMQNVLLFVQTVLYSGTSNETYVDTRVRLYKKLKNKSSLSLPADPDSMSQEIKRCHLQSYIWLNCLQGVISELDPENYGWYVGNDDEMHPTWFTESQFPPFLRKVNRNRKKVEPRSQTIEYIGDSFDGDNSHESDASTIAEKKKEKQKF